MTRTFKTILIIYATFSALSSVAQQGKNPSCCQGSVIYKSIGIEPNLVATIGYRSRPLAPKSDFRISASWKLLILDPLNGWRLSVGGQKGISLGREWNVITNANIYYAISHSRMGHLKGIGLETRITAMRSGRRITFGPEVGWQSNLLLHVRHSGNSKSTFMQRYPVESGRGPRDGWYVFTVNRFRAGLVMQAILSGRMQFNTAVGGMINSQRQGIMFGFSHGQIPFYFELTTTYNLKSKH